MRKGNYGLNLWVYPAVAFTLAVFGQTMLNGILVLFVLAMEKDEWTSKQTLQAFFLGLVKSAFSALTTLFGVITWIPLLGGAVSSVLSFISRIISIVVVLIGVSSIMKVTKEQEVKLPLISGLVDKFFL